MKRPRPPSRSVGAAIAIAVSLTGCGPPRVDLPSEQPVRTTAASPDPSATRFPASEPPATPATPPVQGNVLAAPGAIVISNIEAGAGGAWILNVDVIQPDHSIISGSIDFAAPDGWVPRTQAGRVKLTADGWAAIDVDALAVDDGGVAVINVLGVGQPSGAIVGTAPVWLLDGTLLLSLEDETIYRRIADHGFGAALDFADDGQSPPIPTWHHGYVVEGDQSGLVGWESEYGHPPYVTLGWDGSVNPRPASQATYLATGTERLAGAAGARTVYRGDCRIGDPCRYDWRRQGGERLPIPGVPWDLSWTRDGSELVIFDGSLTEELQGSHVARIEDGPAGLKVTSLAPVPFPGLETGQITWIAGMSDWAVVIENDEDQVVIIPLDDSPTIGPFDGWLAAVNP